MAVAAHGTGAGENMKCGRLRAAREVWWLREARRSERPPAGLLAGGWEGAEWADTGDLKKRVTMALAECLHRERKRKKSLRHRGVLIAERRRGGSRGR
jgi:hypothetical protein